MGEVYLARDEQLERDVAIKILPAGALADESARKRLHKEAIALSRLNHPNIATIYEVDTQEQVDFLVMEYVPGLTLSEKLARGALAEKEIIRLGTQLAEGLAAAHGQGVVHRDLKPGNLAVTPDGRLKILDFGLAKLLRPSSEDARTEGVSKSGGTPGTLSYMSPEQLRGEPADTRSDLYAAGVVLYEMATGQRLVAHGKGLLPAMDAILYQPAPGPSKLNPQVSSGLESIILKCLEKDAGNRYQSAIELAIDLRRLSEGTASALVPPPRAVARLRWPAALVTSLVVALLVAGGGMWWRGRAKGAGPPARIQALAVIPLENFSRDREGDYFADGMTDALITDLGQVRALRVISRTSVMRFKGAPTPIGEIARELNVDAIVEGSVWRFGNRARVSARLIYAPTDTQLWSNSYEHDLRDVLALQREVASAIVNEIKITLSPQEQARLSSARAVNPAAHEAYLKGNYLNKGTTAQKSKAKEYFEQAARLDPSYAPAYAGLAEYYWFTSEVPPRVAMPKAEQYALKALELDPSLAQAHTALGAVRFYADWNWGSAEKEFKEAVRLNPSDAEAHRTYSFYLAALGRVEEALAEIRRAQEVDPLYVRAQVTAGWVFYYARRYDQAIEQCQKALELDPNWADGHECLGVSYLAQGMYEQAIAACRQAVIRSGNDPSHAVGLGRAYALAGRRAEARKVLEELRDLSKRGYVPPYFLAELHVAIGEHQQAFTWLARAYEGRDPNLVKLKVDLAVDPLRSDPRFPELLRRIGLPQ